MKIKDKSVKKLNAYSLKITESTDHINFEGD